MNLTVVNSAGVLWSSPLTWYPVLPVPIITAHPVWWMSYVGQTKWYSVYADAHGTENRLSLRKSRGKNNHASWLTIEDETEEVEISWTKRSKRDTKRWHCTKGKPQQIHQKTQTKSPSPPLRYRKPNPTRLPYLSCIIKEN